MTNELPLIKVVGISASGKSTLVAGLRELGYDARPVSQEHSNVPDLWQQMHPPALLIYLDLDLAGQQVRRPDVAWSRRWWLTEAMRLTHAREHADLRIDTAELGPPQVLQIARIFLDHDNVRHADKPLPQIAPTGGARRTG